MAPYPVTLIGYLYDNARLQDYRAQHGLHPHRFRPLLEHLESALGLTLALVCVDDDPKHIDAKSYLCCYADAAGWRAYSTDALAAVPVPDAIQQLPEILPGADGGLQRVFAPRAKVHVSAAKVPGDIFTAVVSE